MKKLYFASAFILITSSIFAQAINFTANDCAGNSHTLFSELDAGKVVVVSFVMPCGSCIAPTKSADAAVQAYASSNPGQVVFYVVHYTGTGNSCSSLATWESQNIVTPDATFYTTAFNRSQYSSASTMNRIVVLGGTSHTVYYNNGNGGSTQQTPIQNAINSALAAIATGIKDNQNNVNTFNVYPNPANEAAYINYSLKEAADVKIDLYNLVGEKVKSVASGIQTAGNHKVELNTGNLVNGIYFVNVNGNTIKFTIAN